MFWGSIGSKSRLAKATGAEPFGGMSVQKAHAAVAPSTFRIKMFQAAGNGTPIIGPPAHPTLKPLQLGPKERAVSGKRLAEVLVELQRVWLHIATLASMATSWQHETALRMLSCQSMSSTPGSWVLQLPKGIGDRKRIDTASFAAKNSIGWVDLVDPAKVSKYSHLGTLGGGFGGVQVMGKDAGVGRNPPPRPTTQAAEWFFTSHGQKIASLVASMRAKQSAALGGVEMHTLSPGKSCKSELCPVAWAFLSQRGSSGCTGSTWAKRCRRPPHVQGIGLFSIFSIMPHEIRLVGPRAWCGLGPTVLGGADACWTGPVGGGLGLEWWIGLLHAEPTGTWRLEEDYVRLLLLGVPWWSTLIFNIFCWYGYK